jgi:ribosomal protein S18 acetylase RimI-like enzyme
MPAESDGLRTRIATAADAGTIVTLVNAAFAIEKAFVDGERTSLEEIQQHLQKGVFLVADDSEGSPVACAYVEQRGYRAYMGMLSVDPARQGMGLGRRMMTAIEEYCRAHRVRSMDIRILSLRPELPPFYRKLGFAEEGTAPYENPKCATPAHFILLSKNLS